MHIFITGGRGVGKSTLIKNALRSLNVTPSGFVTEWEGDTLYIRPADRSSSGKPVAVRLEGKGREVYREAFDVYGTALIRASAGAELILMDELGFMESSAEEFRRAVMEVLDGHTPILGALREHDSDFLSSIAEHPNVELITLTVENRDEMPAFLETRLRQILKI